MEIVVRAVVLFGFLWLVTRVVGQVIEASGMTLAGNGFGGDAAYTSAAMGEGRAPPP